MPRKILFGAFFLGALTVITYFSLSTIPFEVPDLGIDITDKLGHALAYGTTMFLGCLFWRECNPQKTISLQDIQIIGIALFSYGTIIEVLQYVLPVNRWAEIWDIIANGLGILTAAILCRFLFKGSSVKKA